MKALRRATGSFVTGVLLRVFLLAWAVTVIYPLFWMIISSFKTNREFYMSPWALPEMLHFENYINAWITSKFSEYFLNSVIVIVGTVVLYLIMLTTTSYALVKYQFRGGKALQNFWFFAMMIPSILLTIPLYFFMQSMHLTDNRLVLMVIYAVQALPGGIFLLTGFIKNISDAFIEAAYLDGAGEWQVFTKVIIPFVKPIVLFLGIGNVMRTWNEYVMALTFLKSEEKFTVPIGLSYLTNTMEYRADFGSMFAALTISVLPILVIYAIFQKQILSGVDAGEGVKG